MTTLYIHSPTCTLCINWNSGIAIIACDQIQLTVEEVINFNIMHIMWLRPVKAVTRQLYHTVIIYKRYKLAADTANMLLQIKQQIIINA